LQARAVRRLQVIGKALGHRSQQSTAIYSRLSLEPVRSSMASAASAMFKSQKIGTKLAILKVRRRHG